MPVSLFLETGTILDRLDRFHHYSREPPILLFNNFDCLVEITGNELAQICATS